MLNTDYTCPVCKAINSIPPKLIGGTIECLKCDGKFVAAPPVVRPQGEQAKLQKEEPIEKRKKRKTSGIVKLVFYVMLFIVLFAVVKNCGSETGTGMNANGPVNLNGFAVPIDGVGSVYCFSSPYEFNKHVKSNGTYKGDHFLIQPRTRLKIHAHETPDKITLANVTVLDGPHSGRKGWVTILEIEYQK